MLEPEPEHGHGPRARRPPGTPQVRRSEGPSDSQHEGGSTRLPRDRRENARRAMSSVTANAARLASLQASNAQPKQSKRFDSLR